MSDFLASFFMHSDEKSSIFDFLLSAKCAIFHSSYDLLYVEVLIDFIDDYEGI